MAPRRFTAREDNARGSSRPCPVVLQLLTYDLPQIRARLCIRTGMMAHGRMLIRSACPRLGSPEVPMVSRPSTAFHWAVTDTPLA